MNATEKTGDLAPAHDGLFYSSDQELLHVVVPFVRDAVTHNEAVLVVASDHTREVLEPVLRDIGPVEYVNPSVVFRRTATAVHTYRELVEKALGRGARRVRALNEVHFGETLHARAETIRFEAVANVGLAAHPLWHVCLYDVRRTPPDLLSASAHAHPYVVSADDRRPNPEYVPPVELLRRHSQIPPYTIEAQPPDLEFRDLSAVGLSTLRRAIQTTASAATVLPQGRIDDFIEALSEIASNSLVHGEAPVTTRVWVTQQRIVCTVTDRGNGFDDPLAGFLPASPNALPVHGSGLWLARNFSDSLDFSTSDDGFTARLACWTN
jgi:anti-sigma regulatory factor (Ser/Thr protein kinase)